MFSTTNRHSIVLLLLFICLHSILAQDIHNNSKHISGNFSAATCSCQDGSMEITKSANARLQPVSNRQLNIFCIRQDRYAPSSLLLCSRNALYRFKLPSKEYELIAGDNTTASFVNEYGDRARFNKLRDVVQINANDFVAADQDNSCLRQIVFGYASTFAGQCQNPGYADGSLTEALFNRPMGLLFLEDNQRIIVADSFNNGLRMIHLVTGIVETLVRGTDCQLGDVLRPSYMSFADPTNQMIAVASSNGILKVNITTGSIVKMASHTNFGNLSQSDMLINQFPSRANDLTTVVIVADTRNNRIIHHTLSPSLNVSKEVAYASRVTSICGFVNQGTDPQIYIGRIGGGIHQLIFNASKEASTTSPEISTSKAVDFEMDFVIVLCFLILFAVTAVVLGILLCRNHKGLNVLRDPVNDQNYDNIRLDNSPGCENNISESK